MSRRGKLKLVKITASKRVKTTRVTIQNGDFSVYFMVTNGDLCLNGDKSGVTVVSSRFFRGIQW